MACADSDYRDYLRRGLRAAQSTRRPLSMRAYARFLGLTPSHFLGVLQGTKNLSPERSVVIAKKLKLAPEETEHFICLVQYENIKDPFLKMHILKRARHLKPAFTARTMPESKFSLLNQWYYLPIFELARIEKSGLQPNDVAQRLGLTLRNARTALATLEKEGLLVRHPKGHLTKACDRIQFNAPGTQLELRRFHSHMLRRAARSLSLHAADERAIGSETFPMSASKLPEARQIIDDFLNRILELTRGVDPSGEVFHVGVQLFRLSQRNP